MSQEIKVPYSELGRVICQNCDTTFICSLKTITKHKDFVSMAHHNGFNEAYVRECHKCKGVKK